MHTIQGDNSPQARLIVNADDYGYFRCVSDGILQAIDNGAVTATGVMATGPHFAKLIGPLKARPSVDVGVHLDLSWGIPAEDGMRRTLARSGRFPGRNAAASAILSGRIKASQVLAEWREQIERVLAQGLSVRFLNSHEHIHLLPPLNRLIDELAERYEIPFLRHITPELRYTADMASVARSLVVGLVAPRRQPPGDRRRIPCLGLGRSGQLDMAYLRRRLAALPPGSVSELMCHPGLDDSAEIEDPSLRRYHAWKQELSTLLSHEFPALCRQQRIELIRYRDISAPQAVLRGQ